MNNIFGYRVGLGLFQIECPEEWGDEEDFSDHLKRQGWHHTEDINQGPSGHGPSGEIYEHPNDHRWWMALDYGFKGCFIYAEGWPDFLDLLRYITPIAGPATN